jgi:hypothetical protein
MASHVGLGPKNDCADKEQQQFKRQTCPLVREGTPYQQTRTCSTKNLALGSSCVLDTKTDWLTVIRNMTFESDFELQLVTELLGFSRCQMLLRLDSLGTQKKPLPSSGSEGVTVDT